MIFYLLCLFLGLILLVWSADRFVGGASRVAKYFGMPPILIGMVVIGFGTSAPEMVVSTLASLNGNAGIALGNAYGSNITNIGLILGATALLMPISVHSRVLRQELPILTFVTLLSIGLIYDLSLSRTDALILLLFFSLLMSWTIWVGLKNGKDALASEMETELNQNEEIGIQKSFLNLSLGLILLIISSRVLVYGAVGIATSLGVTDIVIGLTVVAVGTSLPELASSIIAAKKGEPDIALGNILGSNLFNTLAVVGIAGFISPLSFEREILNRDVFIMLILTLSIFLFGYGFKGKGRINRFEGSLLLTSYIAYVVYLISTSV
jgi:cation:H+ antiporter